MTGADAEAFAVFYKDNRGPVFRALLAGTLNRAAAEDATAEAFARAFADWPTVAAHPAPRAWVLRVAWNHARSCWRTWEGRWAAGQPAPVPPAADWCADPDLVAAIRRLPPGQRQVLVWVALGELTPAQTAKALGKADGTVRGQLARARAALRQALAEDCDPEGRDG